MDAERFLLKWNNHQSNLVTVFDQLYEQEAFTDVTLACDGRSFAAHKVILSACSPYFQQLFLSNPCKHPIIFMRDVRAGDLDALLAFMYRGEINVHQQDLAPFLKTAESLQIKGLSDSSDKPRDTSKILEAMEKKFSSSSSSTSTSATPGASSNCLTGVGGIGGLIGRSLNRASPISSTGINALSRSFLSHTNSNHALDGHGGPPPEKKFKPTPDEFTRILPKLKSLMSSQSLISPVPGFVTPITLAATVMKTATHAPSIPIPYIPPLENNNSPARNADSSSPSKVKKETTLKEPDKDPLSSEEKNTFVEGYISGDAPHPVYLVSSVGGMGLDSSGNSTPSHEVKIEEEDPLEENALSDDPGSMGPNDSMDDHALSLSDDALGSCRDRLTYPCRFCGKRFTQTGTCRRHERLHTAPNSFKCPFCGKGFNRKYRLKEHILSAHPEHADDKDLTVLINNSDTMISTTDSLLPLSSDGPLTNNSSDTMLP